MKIYCTAQPVTVIVGDSKGGEGGGLGGGRWGGLQSVQCFLCAGNTQLYNMVRP